MTVTTVIKDILTVTEGIIAHQVNLQGVMGAGLAKQIKLKYPDVFDRYRYFCKIGELKLGTNLSVKINDRLWVCNMAAQEHYGRMQRHTDYEALKTCLRMLRSCSIEHDFPVFLPYGVGCGLAGGDWAIVFPMIEECLGDVDVTICRLG